MVLGYHDDGEDGGEDDNGDDADDGDDDDHGFSLTHAATGCFKGADALKKQVVPAGQARKCSVTKPQFNVTLVGGIHSGVFSEVPNAHDMSSCVRHCCLRPSCQVSFMIKDSCYLVDCFNARLCKTKAARPSSLAPQISYVEHLKAAAGVDPGKRRLKGKRSP